jgi:hypothetical protein
MTNDPSVLNHAAQLELSQYERSYNPVHLALLDLYRQGQLRIGGMREGQIVLQVNPEAVADG